MAWQRRGGSSNSKAATGNDLTITIPAGAQDDDIIVIWYTHQNDTATISGDATTTFTLIPDGIERHSGATLLGGFWFGLCVAATHAGTTYTFTSTSTQRAVVICEVWYNDTGGGTITLDVSNTIEEGATATHTLPTDTTTQANTLLFGGVGTSDGVGGTQSHTHNHLTEQQDVGTASPVGSVGTQEQASAGSTGTKTVTFSAAPSTATWVSQLLAFYYDTGGGGTVHELELAGALTPSGTIEKQTRIEAVSSTTPSGVIVRDVFISAAGTIASSGTVTKETSRTLASDTTPTGTLDAIKTALVAVAGTVTSSGLLAKRTDRDLAGTVTSAGEVAKQTERDLASTTTPSGTLDALKAALLSVAGTVASSGALVQELRRTLTGSVTPSGDLTKQGWVSFEGTVASSGVVTSTKLSLLSLAGTVASSGVLVKQVSRSLVGTLGPTGTVGKQIRRALGAVVSIAGSIVTSLNGEVEPETGTGTFIVRLASSGDLRVLEPSAGRLIVKAGG